LTISYDASTSSYTVATGGASQTFGPANLSTSADVSRYSRTVGTNRDVLALTRATSGTRATQYVGLGMWERGQISGSTQTSTFDWFTYGLDTPGPAVPKSGSARYALNVIGVANTPGGIPRRIEGAGEFEADFVTGYFNLDATSVLYELFPATPGSLSGITGFQLAYTGRLAADGSFSAPRSAAGELNGRFYGPGAEEVGGTFSSAGVSGAFAGPRSSTTPLSNFSLNNIVVIEGMSARSAVLATRPDGVGGTIIGQSRSNVSVGLFPGGNIQLGPTSSGSPPPPDGVFTAAQIVADPSRPNFNVYGGTRDGVPGQLAVYKIGASNSELSLSYASFGSWRTTSGTPYSDVDEYFDFGVKTRLSTSNKLMGSAHYSGVAYGAAFDSATQARYNVSGLAEFDVVLDTQSQFNGNLTLSGSPPGSATPRDFGSFAITGIRDISGRVPATQGGVAVGNVSPSFYGPLAEEIGGAFQFQVTNPVGGGSTYLSGAMAAKR
jgi:hypothetical protein